MAPLFWLEVTDWKKDNDQVRVSKPVFDNFFSSNWKKNKLLSYSLKSLKYFDNEADLDVNKVNSKINYLSEKIPYINYDAFKLFSDYKRSLCYREKSIVASKSILSRIMNTPFDINQDMRKWTFNAEIIGDKNCIYIYYDKDNENKLPEGMAKHYELLRHYLFVKLPKNYYRKVTFPFNEIFGCLMYIQFGEDYLCYTTEIPGIIRDQMITNYEELRASEHIYYDIFEAGEFSQDMINYNPIWWSKATLMNAKQCILASYDKENDCLKDIHKFNMDKFEDRTKYENLWSPEAAWDFLNNFIKFVKDSVNCVSSDIRKKCIWKFQSFPNDESVISCEILIRNTENGQETLTPITLDVTNFP